MSTAAGPRPGAGYRVRSAAIAAIALLHAAALLLWTQRWATARLEEIAVAVPGESASPALPALAVAGLALAAALALAGPVIRRVLGLLQAALGVAIGIGAVLVLTDPVRAAADAIAAATGIAAADRVEDLAVLVEPTAVPALTLAVAAASALTGLGVLASPRWPERRRDGRVVRFESAGGGDPWASLDSGQDPTAPGDESGAAGDR